MTFRVVIPARFASSRFPGKPLARLGGRAVLERVFTGSRASGAADVLIATDDERIRRAARDFGATVVMTRPDHQSGTDRVAEVAAQRGWDAQDIVVNVQGDAPFTPAASIRQVAGLLESHPDADLATLCVPVLDLAAYRDPHVVKVAMDSAGRALYFSRSPIPAAGHGSGPQLPTAWRHLGLYAYRVESLRRLTAEQPCYLETTERLEQLRALWLGMEIRVGIAEEAHGPDVDTPEDLEAAARYLAEIGGGQ
jgi:3-deoxy-manno-octulosonate cytidylyltransferase (CMP-KDO synthetase)